MDLQHVLNRLFIIATVLIALILAVLFGLLQTGTI